MLTKIEVLNPQSQAFREAEAASIEELGHQSVATGEAVENLGNFFSGQNCRQVFGSAGANVLEWKIKGHFEHDLIEEDDGV